MLGLTALHTLRFGLVLCLAAVAVSQKATDSTRDAWTAFRQEAPGHWLVDWHPATGTPRAIYGQGLQIHDWRENTIEESRRHANAALQRWPELLGLGTSDFHEVIGARMGRTWTFTFAQSFRDLPVIGGRVDVRIHMRGRWCYLGSTAWNVPADFNTTPKIDVANATAIAWLSLAKEPNQNPQPGIEREPRLVIWGDATASALASIHLAWEIPISAIDATGDGPIGRVYVDANTGAQLDYTNDKHECGLSMCYGGGSAPPATYTVMGYLHSGTSPVATPTNEPLAGVEVDVPGHGTLITDQFGQFSVNLANPTTVTVVLDGIHSKPIQGSNPLTSTLVLQPGVNQTLQLGSPNSSQNQLAHTTAYYWVYRINELARSILGNSAELAVADQVQATVNITNTCNAWYAANSINFYQAGGNCNNTASASVIAHEWGHGLDDRYGGISQVNGLSEGWGDICSIYLLDDPIIGHGFFQGGGSLRTGNNNRQYPSGGGVHSQGESWMGFAWKFRQNLRAAFGTPQAIAISNEVVLGSIAANAGAQATAVIQAFLADDDDGNLVNGTPHHAELAAACQSHSLPYPPILAGYIGHDIPLGTTGQQLAPRLVTCDAVPSYGTFTQVRVHYDDGQPGQRIMIPATGAHAYQALLPGMLSPQVMSYHFEAVHSGGSVFRLPETGEFTYHTRAEVIWWSEDFESGALGWTHGSFYGTDDWEIDVPGGHSGSNWVDPSMAATGSQCAGTDLTGDGAYAPASLSWLRSPPIDCTGVTGMRLRFKRWASCDVNSQDRLELRLANQVHWLNPAGLLQETQWGEFEMAAGYANNNPALVIEFRMQSNATSNFGGWNIDDVELYTTTLPAPVTTQLRIQPSQVAQGMPLQLTVQTPTLQAFVVVIGDQPGPIFVPGLPAIHVGGNYATLLDVTDQSGNYALTFNAPATVPLTGSLFYSQVLAITPGGGFETSNRWLNLITQ